MSKPSLTRFSAGRHTGVLQERGGWESTDMVPRNAHLTPDHLAEFAERLSRPRAIGGTNLAHVDIDQKIRLMGVSAVSIENSGPFFWKCPLARETHSVIQLLLTRGCGQLPSETAMHTSDCGSKPLLSRVPNCTCVSQRAEDTESTSSYSGKQRIRDYELICPNWPLSVYG